jgi:hypothetical protein
MQLLLMKRVVFIFSFFMYASCFELKYLPEKRLLTRKAMYIWRNIEVLLRKECFRGKEIGITYSECVSVAAVIQHVKRLRRILLTPVACLDILYFPTLSR